MEAIGKELARSAKKNGICMEWYNQLIDLNDKDKLVQMYVDGIDFCISNDWPSNEYIRDNFKGVMEKHGVHLDEALNVTNEPKTVALGACNGIVEVNDFRVCQVFAKHDSDIVIMARDNAHVMIDIFDNAVVSVIACNSSRVYVNRYGGRVDFEKHHNSSVIIKEKNKKTY